MLHIYINFVNIRRSRHAGDLSRCLNNQKIMQLVTGKYDGAAGRRTLSRDLRRMILLEGSKVIAAEVAESAEVLHTEKGDTLIQEGDDDHDIYFVLSGRLQVSIRDREFAVIGPGAHVGEIALVNPNADRCATVRALQDTVTARLSAVAFKSIAERHQALWRRMSQVLGNHLSWNNQFLKRPNARPRVLVCASEIGLPFALAMKTQAADDAKIPAWTVETRCIETPDSLQPLQQALSEADLGVIVIAPGDLEFHADGGTLARKVFLQCGICLGALGETRSIVVQPSDLSEDSPAAILGLTPLTYRLEPHEALRSDIESICSQLQAAITDLGSR